MRGGSLTLMRIASFAARQHDARWRAASPLIRCQSCLRRHASAHPYSVFPRRAFGELTHSRNGSICQIQGHDHIAPWERNDAKIWRSGVGLSLGFSGGGDAGRAHAATGWYGHTRPRRLRYRLSTRCRSLRAQHSRPRIPQVRAWISSCRPALHKASTELTLLPIVRTARIVARVARSRSRSIDDRKSCPLLPSAATSLSPGWPVFR